MKDSGFFTVVVIVLVVVFFIVGGSLHPSGSPNQVHIGYDTSPPANPSISASGAQESPASASAVSTTSPYLGKIRLTFGNPASRDPNTEYVQISAAYSNKQSISISGWRLYSPVTGRSVTIGYGSSLPALGGIANENIVLAPGDYAYIISGASPEGLSFRDNKCTGYFAQTKQFYPGLSGSCPRPGGAVPYQSVSNPNGLPVDCQDYINSLPYCSIAPSAPARYALCADYVDQHFSYQGCVNDFKNDQDFFLNHWFVYENQNEPVWSPSHETIVLYDIENKPVDSFSY